jgi:hypothetical protein
MLGFLDFLAQSRLPGTLSCFQHEKLKYFELSLQEYATSTVSTSLADSNSPLQEPFFRDMWCCNLGLISRMFGRTFRLHFPSTKNKSAVAIRPQSRERRQGIAAHSSISYSVYRRIINGWFLRTSVNLQHIYLLLHCRVDCKLAKDNKKNPSRRVGPTRSRQQECPHSWRMPCSGMLRRVAFERTDASE